MSARLNKQQVLIPFNKFLTNDGTGTPSESPDNYNAIGNYTSPTEFYYTVPAGMSILLKTLRVQIEDTGSVDTSSYGNGITLTGNNGILIQVKSGAGAVLNEITQGLRVRNILHWGRFGVPEHLVFGTGSEAIIMQTTIPDPIRVTAGNRIAVVLQGNFTGLNAHFFLVGGVFQDMYH